jgi:threonine dehydrogenase-like Zn-dependent dehydrogenase
MWVLCTDAPGRMMKAVVFNGSDVKIEHVPMPKIVDPKDVIVKVTMSAICKQRLWVCLAND